MKTLIIERKLNKIENWQDETTIKYFLMKDKCDKYKIMISEQSNNENTELEINKLFDDKQMALNLIKLLCENSISLEQSNKVIEDLLKDKGDKNKVRTLIAERKLDKIGSWQDETTIRYFLLDDCNRYKIMISEQSNNENTELEINKSFDDKQMALDLIEFLYENSILLEQSNEVIEDLLKDKGDKNKVRILVAERKLSRIKNWQEEIIIKYFLSKDNYDKYKILISQQSNNENAELEINKSFDDKQMALDLIEFLYENSISLEHSNEIIEDLLRKREK